MERIKFIDGVYKTAPRNISAFSKAFPGLSLYSKITSVVFRAAHKAKRGRYDDAGWEKSSLETVDALEKVGINIEVTGAENIEKTNGPCVFIGNHMSTLETFVLPCLILPFKKATFVIKKSLMEYPVFGHVMRARNPVTVGRTNPREDLRAVLEGGADRLRAGISIIIFPQTTRILDFDPKEFNTIGIKLAKKADVPVIPLALKTDAWGNGRYLKDFGKIDPSKSVHLAFGEPLRIKDRGAEEHDRIIEFITSSLSAWKTESRRV